MTRRVWLTAAVLAALVVFAQVPAFAQDPDVYVSTGPAGEILLGLGGTSYQPALAANAGFKPEEIAFAGDGSLYICDASNSEIFRLTDAGLVTIYDRNSTTSVNPPEQPKGCTIAGNDLLFLSRNGNGKGAKTGLWAIQNVTGVTPGEPVILKSLDAVGGLSGHGLAVNFDGRVFFTFGTEVWVATPQPGSGRIDEHADFRIWGSTLAEGFGIATRAFPDPATASLRTQVFVAAKFSGVIEVLEEVTPGGGGLPVGSATGCSVIDVPDLPNSLDFDGSGDLWVATSQQSSGRRGAVYEIDAPGCGTGPFTVDLRGDGLDGALGIALTPTGSEPVTLSFPEGSEKSNVVNLCNSTFNLDRVTSLCQDTWTVSCRLLSKTEFDTRSGYAVGSPTADPAEVVQDDFSFTQCADFPGAGGNCTEIRIKQVVDESECQEDDIIRILANWQFYSLANLDHPGLLYSPGDFPTSEGNPVPENAPFSENILTSYDPVPVPTDPLDPRATGSRDAWGSGIIVVEDAPNRPPTAVLSVTPTAAQCGMPVTLDGSGSFDSDWNVDHPDSITNWNFTVDGVSKQSSMIDFYVLDTSGLAAGDYSIGLEVSDEGWDVNGPLTDSTTETLTILPDTDAPAISDFRLEDLGHPEITVAPDGQSATMWSPHHDLRAFLVSYLAEDGCRADCRLLITSNQPESGNGEGDQAPDIIVTGPTTFDLRAERTPSEEEASRFYTVRLACTDGTNTSYSANTITIEVPASQGSGGE